LDLPAIAAGAFVVGQSGLGTAFSWHGARSTMSTATLPASIPPIELSITSVRQQRVILDRDLAVIYGVETRALNQAVKRNRSRFPEEFMFNLTRSEVLSISQTVTSLRNSIASVPPVGMPD
jgi:hypothetical protein